jgi:hypothetical protein
MREMALKFYQHLYTSEGSSQEDVVLQLIHSFVTDDMNAKLTGVF